MFSDAKHPVTESGKNAIQTSIRAASKQKVEEVVIRLDREYSNRSLYEGMRSAFQQGRASGIKTVILIRKEAEPVRLSVDQIRKFFYK